MMLTIGITVSWPCPRIPAKYEVVADDRSDSCKLPKILPMFSTSTPNVKPNAPSSIWPSLCIVLSARELYEISVITNRNAVTISPRLPVRNPVNPRSAIRTTSSEILATKNKSGTPCPSMSSSPDVSYPTIKKLLVILFKLIHCVCRN